MIKRSSLAVSTLTLEEYIALMRDRAYPLYFAPWWLSRAIVTSPLFLLCYLGTHHLAVFVAEYSNRELYTPTFCQYAGLWFLEEDLTAYDKQCITHAIHQALPSHFHYHLAYSPCYTDWLGLYWLKYRQTTRYNYVWEVSSLKTSDQFAQSISTSLRKNLNATVRAGFTYDASISLEELSTVLYRTSVYKGYKTNLRVLLGLVDSAFICDAGRLVGVCTPDGKLAMVAFWVEHQGTAYLIGEGTDRDISGKYQLKVFMLMNYIESRQGVIDKIDFEGSMLEPIAKIYQALGARQVPYMVFSKGSRWSPLVLFSRIMKKCF